MNLKAVLKKIKGGALTITEEEALAVTRSWLARDLYLVHPRKSVPPL